MQIKDLDRLYSDHPATAEQEGRIASLRLAAKQFGLAIMRLSPESAEQTLALRRIEEVLHYGIAAIQREPSFAGTAIKERIDFIGAIEGKLSGQELARITCYLGLKKVLGDIGDIYEGMKNGKEEDKENPTANGAKS